MENRVCVICGATFKPNSSTQMCCSTECANKKTHETLKRYNNCVICGTPFWKPNAHRFKYCSPECRKIALANRPRKEKPTPIVYTRNCEWCGTSFSTTIPNKKYCSHECSYQGNLRDKRNQWANAYVPRTLQCKECGTEFVTECGASRSVFCCDHCAETNERRREHSTARHKQYMRGKKTEREKLISQRFVEEVTFESIYKRDCGVCQICGLPVHPVKGVDNSWDGTIDHIVPLSVGGEHSMANCQLAHRICNSIKCQASTDFTLNWTEKAKENNYWKTKYQRYVELMNETPA